MNETLIGVQDPSNNVIQQWLGRVPVKGIWGESLGLSEEPPLGEWRIVGELADGFRVTKTFTVEKYGCPALRLKPRIVDLTRTFAVLPKFEVKVSPPSYVTVQDDVVVQVSAK